MNNFKIYPKMSNSKFNVRAPTKTFTENCLKWKKLDQGGGACLAAPLLDPPMPTDVYRPQTKFAKVMFLHLSVSHSVHGEGGCLPQCRHPLRSDTPPRANTPLGADNPPTHSRHPPTPTPWSRHPPCAVHAGRYGQLAGGTHPTGMHTCF